MLRQSDSIELLAKALAAAQAEMPTVAKDKNNPFFKSKYADLSSVIQTVAPIITKHGLSVTQLPDWDGTHDLLTTRLMHESGQWIEASMRLMPVKQDPQSQGSAITYARRYAYCATLGIVADEDDDGNGASRPAASSVPAPAQAASKQTTRVQAPKTPKPTDTGTAEKPQNMRKLFAMLSGIGVGEDDRHTWASKALGREVTTYAKLTGEDIILLEKAAKEQQMNKSDDLFTKEDMTLNRDDDPTRPF